ncbi:hypothetical protein [Gracilibacillus thailandensis]|uniref:Helicase/UvrB N-terminal domain-containing protein n=1 Tax=Gracilibacillus thailandensis TaxID=563735 RepID=A0A6N7QTK0_9BACI|nr:hypothetical protein [Gracilibacillus thailandensis]MRI65348.1 hypothetical protein [Gracilibacillus thailandensis]
MSSINVIDSIMGSGKTQYAIQYMNEATELERFIYITPFLDEVQRIKDSVQDRTFKEPDNRNNEGTKLRSLKDLIAKGEDIASTHALFRTADDEVIDLLTEAGYTLILDEVMTCVEPINVRPSDIRKLERAGDIEITDNRVIWKGDPNDDSRYLDIRLTAQAGNLFYYRGKFLVWSFPPDVFKAFDKVYVMTYLFDGQIQKYYFDMHGFNFDLYSVKHDGEKYRLLEYDKTSENRKELYGLIDVYQGKLNDIGKRKNALGVRFLQKADIEYLAQVKKNLYNYFQNIAKAKREEVYYSTLKEIEKTIQPKGYKEPRRKKGEDKKPPQVVIPHNARATNLYGEKRAMAYIFNRYMNQEIKVFFQDNGVKVSDDVYAVGELLQWIYRSRIRNGEPVELYLPSSRMRQLLQDWSEYKL